MTLDEALNQFREEFPLFFNFCKKVQEGKLPNSAYPDHTEVTKRARNWARYDAMKHRK